MPTNRVITPELVAAAGQFEKERQYWLEKLSGGPGKTIFPYDTDKVMEERHTSTETFTIPAHLSGKLIRAGNGSDQMLHMILTTGVITLLNKYSGDNDITVGMPIYRQETEGEFLNTILALRCFLNERMTFKDLLLQVRQTVIESTANQNYPFELLVDDLGLTFSGSDFPLLDMVILLENIHQKEYLQRFDYCSMLNMIFSFKRTGNRIDGEWEYNSNLYGKQTITRLINHFNTLLRELLANSQMKLIQVEMASEEERYQLLHTFNDTALEYPREKNLCHLFREEAEKQADKIALVSGNTHITYRELNEKSNRLANYLFYGNNIRPDHCVGILADRSINFIISVLGILEAGGAYTPLEPSLPENRLKKMIDDANIRLVISEKQHIKLLNRLQWQCRSFHTFLCLDSNHIIFEVEQEINQLMDTRLWNVIGEEAVDEISGGGWVSSYTGEPLSKEEMQEYGENVLKKLNPLLNPSIRALEIGCASGITMFRLAPLVNCYYGVDLSRVIIEKNKEKIKQENIKNIHLSCLAAHEIDQIKENNFDIVIINSVIHYFHGHNYLRKVIEKALHLMTTEGYIFIGDVLNQDLKDNLIEEMRRFKEAHPDKNYRTKTDWSHELFVSPSFFTDLGKEIPSIKNVIFSNKIHTRENELTKFRYDILVHIDKSQIRSSCSTEKSKHQHDLKNLQSYGTWAIDPPVKPGNLAYVMFTSGSTGIPKGVMVEHRNVINLITGIAAQIGFSPGKTMLALTAVSFDMLVVEILVSLINGLTIVIADEMHQYDPVLLSDLVIKNRVDMLQATPSKLGIYVKNSRQFPCLKNIKELIVSGESLPEDLYHFLTSHFPGRLYNLYGPTEATVWSTIKPLKREEGISIGTPIANTQIYILDKHKKLVPIGLTGELAIGGSGVARGYLNQPELTAKKFISIPGTLYRSYMSYRTNIIYKTGDLARWQPDGNIEFLGRQDHQVKIRGFRIELKEIENHLKSCDNIKEAVAVVREADGEKYIYAYIVPNNEHEPVDPRDYLSKRLPAYMIPAHFVSIKEIPLTNNGKLDRKALLKFDTQTQNLRKNYKPPGNDKEKKIAQIWSEVLRVDNIGIYDNFFDLGGNSFDIITANAGINEIFEKKVPVLLMFRYPTIDSLARYLNNNLSQDIISDVKIDDSMQTMEDSMQLLMENGNE